MFVMSLVSIYLSIVFLLCKTYKDLCRYWLIRKTLFCRKLCEPYKMPSLIQTKSSVLYTCTELFVLGILPSTLLGFRLRASMEPYLRSCWFSAISSINMPISMVTWYLIIIIESPPKSKQNI